MIVVESMEPSLGSLREWLLTSAPASAAGTETPYLLAREVPPPIAFVLHLCTIHSPELLLTLIIIGAVTCGAAASWVGLIVARRAWRLLCGVCGRVQRLSVRAARRVHREPVRGAPPPAPRPPPTSDSPPAPGSPEEAVLAADREARR